LASVDIHPDQKLTIGPCEQLERDQAEDRQNQPQFQGGRHRFSLNLTPNYWPATLLLFPNPVESLAKNCLSYAPVQDEIGSWKRAH
jgi:hypothetical protein